MRKFATSLYGQVLLGIIGGILLGHFEPELGARLKPLGDGFIKLIKMLIAPIIFVTVVSGIGGMGNLRSVGRVGLKALLYFEIVTTLALVIGLVVANVFQPGAGVHATAASLDAAAVASYAHAAQGLSTVDWLLNLIPATFVGAFVGGDILQVLLIALLFGFALAALDGRGQPLVDLLHEVAQVFSGSSTSWPSWRRSRRSAPWPSPSANTGSAPSSRWPGCWPACISPAPFSSWSCSGSSRGWRGSRFGRSSGMCARSC